MEERDLKKAEPAFGKGGIDVKDREIKELCRIIELMRKKESDRMINEDLAFIQKVDPHIKDVKELGDLFIMLRAGGQDVKTAYETVRALNGKKEIAQMGDVGNIGQEKEFYTPDEVRAMSKSQVKKNYEKICNSMSKWK